MLSAGTVESEITHFHLFAGRGAGARGFAGGHARVGRMEARFRCLGGVDSDPHAIRDFGRLVGVPGTVLDLFDREQYRTFHRGKEPPAGWREAVPDDIRRAAGGEFPDIVFLSAPCKGFSGMLSGAKSESPRYQALNRLTVRGVRLMLEAFADQLPSFVLFENVPRIQQRGRELLDDIVHELELAGYAVAETTHDCGELGGLAQHRRRFLLVARLKERIKPFLYEPPKQRVRAVGEVLGPMPLPDDPAGGPMHRLPRLTWRTWERLALIPAGGDWRSLHGLDWQNYRLVPESWGGGGLGVVPWTEPAGAIAGESFPTDGHSVADPRPRTAWGGKGKYKITAWDEAAGTAIGRSGTGNGAFAVADPRGGGDFSNLCKVVGFDEPAPTITGAARPAGGALSLADPRHHGPAKFNNCFRVVKWDEASPAVTGGYGPTSGGIAVADPRACGKRLGEDYQTTGHFGVVPWDEATGAIIGNSKHDQGAFSVADPRRALHLDDDEAPWIISLDGTRHRPFTTLELAALQGFPVWMEDGSPLLLASRTEGRDSHAMWREGIGNAVPVPTAAAIASAMGHALLMARLGRTFELSAAPVWVRPVATALSVASLAELGA